MQMLRILLLPSPPLFLSYLLYLLALMIPTMVDAGSVDTNYISGNFITGANSLPLSDDSFIVSLSNNKIVRVDFTGTGKSEVNTYNAPDVVNYLETLKTGKILGIYHSSVP